MLSGSAHSGQSVQWFVFYMSNPDLSQCRLDFEEVPEFTQVKWGDWDFLLKECPDMKLEMFKVLRGVVEPHINAFLKDKKNK